MKSSKLLTNLALTTLLSLSLVACSSEPEPSTSSTSSPEVSAPAPESNATVDTAEDATVDTAEDATEGTAEDATEDTAEDTSEDTAEVEAAGEIDYMDYTLALNDNYDSFTTTLLEFFQVLDLLMSEDIGSTFDETTQTVATHLADMRGKTAELGQLSAPEDVQAMQDSVEASMYAMIDSMELLTDYTAELLLAYDFAIEEDLTEEEELEFTRISLVLEDSMSVWAVELDTLLTYLDDNIS